MQLIDNLEWRYATKHFDPGKKVSETQLKQIKKAIQLSASSYGLQLYKALIIEDISTREKLKPASWDQQQITEASHLIVFCNYTNLQRKHIDNFLALKSETQQLPLSELKGYGDFMEGKINEKSDEELKHWTAKQTYLALGNLLAACAELKIDACPMEGFEADKYDNILGLSQKGLTASVIAAIGYRSEEDQTQYHRKVRKPTEQLFETI
ncbi:NAD(P)H-dependent oxidoreductase [Fodinibius halophilus]|uniref:NAD(P)H-dependent oxidoreductase n=1 Tax=Fodinibius halophilus TaxID=1736908 RepID=A0A6M1SUC0_9BACT|nr:NAD(P)H-dependent oxidoreductase [Fodinibius halophilus]NGP87116.1 NAD(P)H-dependent oxidoreductase [Fodinibius halophilus]